MGLISKHLCKHTVCMYGMHVQNALDDPTRSSGAPGSGILPVFHFCGIKRKIRLKFQNFKYPN